MLIKTQTMQTTKYIEITNKVHLSSSFQMKYHIIWNVC